MKLRWRKCVLKTAEKRDSYYKRRFKRLAKIVAAINSGKKSRGPAPQKNPLDNTHHNIKLA